MKTCTRCKETKPLSEFAVRSKKRNPRPKSRCRKCESEVNLARHHGKYKPVQTKANQGNREFLTPVEACKSLLVAIVYTAYEDGRGMIVGSAKGREEKHRIMMDGRRFFEDGRWAHVAGYLDLEPDMRPEWG